MNADEVYKICLYACTKNKQQGYLSPEDFHVAINLAQKSYLDYLLGEYQKYQVGRQIAVVEFSGNERVRNSISPLIYGAVLSPNTTTGIAAFPSDYEYPDAMWTLYNFYRIRFTQQDALFSTYRSGIDPIVDNPIFLIKHEGFQFYPENIGNARLSYVRTPPSIVWAYVLDSNNLPVYDAANSQQPVFGDTDMLQIIVRALMLVGVNLSFGTVMQYADSIKNNGQ